MQDLPDKQTLLAGVARFLEGEVRPAVTDRGLAFRIRIAAHLLGVVAREVTHEEAHDRAELDALCALLGREGSVPSGAGDRSDAIREAREALSGAIRAGEVSDGDAVAGLLELLATKLSVSNPRFDLTRELP